MQESIFTKIIKGEIPAYKVFEDDKTLAFLDIHPAVEGHTLVVPKQQVDRLEDMSSEDYTALLRTVKRVMQRLVAVYGDNYRACLKLEGFDVPHAHIHVILALAHPFAPFVTETIWQTLKWEAGLLMTAPWPTASAAYDPTLATMFTDLQAIVTETRFVASQLGAGKQRLLFAQDTLIEENAALIKHLANLEAVEQREQPRGLRLALANHEAWLDIDIQMFSRHTKQLETRLEQCRQQINQLELRLQNKPYIEHAPRHVVDQTHQQLTDAKQLEERLVNELHGVNYSETTH